MSVGVAWLSPAFPWLALVTAFLGLVAVFTSAMIYIDTRRAFWSAPLVMGRFFGATLSLGAVALVTAGAPPIFIAVAMGVQFLLFAWEMSRQSDALQDPNSANSLSARIVAELMPQVVPARALLMLASLGGLALFAVTSQTGWAVGALLTTLIGTVMERYVFFRAVVAPRMPGGFVK
jgi:formate dehydrogenase iron-sulfur subunit